jgi:hypothetical protein
VTDARDVEALRLLTEYATRELPRAKARADKWLAGLTAITGVLTTAALIKGPDTLSKVSDAHALWKLSPRDFVVALLVLGGLLLASGIFAGYTAADGSPLDDDEIDRLARGKATDADGLADKWTAAVTSATRSAKTALRLATVCTGLGVAVLAAALVVAAYNPGPASPDMPTYIQVGGQQVQLGGTLPPVSSGRLQIVACPKNK